MREDSAITPMFQQYQALKHDHQNAILLFRMGDFFEMFYEDAEIASKVLDLTLTARGKGTRSVVPMCGFPHHQLDAYTARLVRSGRNVAICEQVEDPRKAKGLVRREVIRIVTPGTVTDPEQLEAKSNSWVASVSSHGETLGAAFLDASTGEFLAWQSPAGAQPWETLGECLAAFAPKEIVHPEGFGWPEAFRSERTAGAALSAADAFAFATPAATDILARHFAVASLDGFGLRDRPAAVGAAGGLLAYLQETQKSALQHVDRIGVHEPSCYLLLDVTTRRNLEIERSLRDGGRSGSLLHAVDDTQTPAGGRLLRRWILSPLIDPSAIGRRLDAVGELLARPHVRDAVRANLRQIQDIERLVARAVNGTANARDLTALAASLQGIPPLIEALREVEAPLLREALDGADPCADLAAEIVSAIADAPPAGLREGGLIREGYSAELDELRAIRRDGRAYIASLEARERAASGIGSLKVRFNKVFGYYIEVSRSNLHLVPAHYQRKQTIAGGERFVTPELKEQEAKVLQAQERMEEMEYDLFCSLRGRVASAASRLKAAAHLAALVDVLVSFAHTAASWSYVRPHVHDGTALDIVAGRHPVVERSLTSGRFVPNDTHLDAGGEAITILTGPNMGGKSTYLRQVALIVILAQAGSFVPAEEARIGVVDRVFCRVGASDSLTEGQSTFMVEMTETANILHNASARSLALLDEVGRGTSTFDGLAIAWAVVEYLHRKDGSPPRTLFATHYHELTELAVALPGIVNARMAVREWGDRVVFLHRVEPGPSDRSYGIHVARLAGLPQPVVSRAREILANLERDEYGGDGLPRRARSARRTSAPRTQPALFAFSLAEPPATEPLDPEAAGVLAELRSTDPAQITPLEALQRLFAWRRRLDESS
jgi:DNA mismatch repair protein MutS